MLFYVDTKERYGMYSFSLVLDEEGKLCATVHQRFHALKVYIQCAYTIPSKIGSKDTGLYTHMCMHKHADPSIYYAERMDDLKPFTVLYTLRGLIFDSYSFHVVIFQAFVFHANLACTNVYNYLHNLRILGN